VYFFTSLCYQCSFTFCPNCHTHAAYNFFQVNADLHYSQQTKDPSNLIASELASAINAASSTTDLPQPTTSSETVQPDMNLESNSRFQEAVRQKANLERELQLMASAWYDQNARLMSNTVNTTMYRGRAPPEPRSFLGKQRRLIDGVLTGRS
jgi:hypothetical protein